MNPLERVESILTSLGFHIEHDSLLLKHTNNTLQYPLAVIDVPSIDIQQNVSYYHFSIYLLNPSDSPIHTHLAMSNAAGELSVQFNVDVRTQEIVRTQPNISGSLIDFSVKSPTYRCTSIPAQTLENV